MIKTYPLCQAQLGVFIECQQEPESTQYNLAARLLLPTDINMERMEQALRQIIDTRKILHTRIILDENGNPRQYADMNMMIPVGRQVMNDEEADAFINSYVRPYNLLGEDPLCHFDLVETPTRKMLVYNMHHIIADGTTFFGLFPKQDLENAYQGKELKAELKTLYDFAIEEQQQTESPAYAAATDYYHKKFEGVEFADLAGGKTNRMGNTIILYDELKGSSIKAFCEKNNIKDNILLQSAYSLVLSRLCRKQQVAYISVRHGRFDKSLRQTYGMFVKTVPVLMDAAPNMSVADFVGKMAEEWKSTYQMADYSFSDLCTSMHLKPTVCFSYQGSKMNKEFCLDGKNVEFLQLPSKLTGTDLTMLVYQRADAYEIRVVASDALYDRLFLKKFTEAVKVCTLQLIEHWTDSLKDISIVSEEEKKELTALGTGEVLEYDKSMTMVDLFVNQAKATPDAEAVIYQDRRYTYRELDELTTRLAICLRSEYGVKKETVVGVMIDRSEWMVIYPLAVMKAGGAYMPLDFHFPEDRLTYMVEDAQVKLILSEKQLVNGTMPNFGGDVLNKEDVENKIAHIHYHQEDGEVALLQDDKPQPSSAFVVLYTSGSTGRPKGCVLEHHCIVSFCHWYDKDLQITPNDRMAAYANFGFDAHMSDIYPFLAAGASVYILPSDIRMDLTSVHQYMEDNAITFAFFTTQIGVQMATLFEYQHLRAMMVGGEKLLPFKKPAFKFYNAYGPTECTLCCTAYQIRYDNEDAPIGHALANVRLYVMDESLHLVPKGMAGELCIAGEGVGREYLHYPEMTVAKFVDVDGERMYRTGDLVRWNEDGELVFMGRMDNQVKLRGLRIEIGEIETVLSRFPAINMSAVVVKEVHGVQMLCAYYTAEREIDVDELHAFLEKSLTDFMVPEIYTQLEEMPLTPNGKVNRKALPEPIVEKGEIIAPETTTEKELFDVVAELLNTTDFGVTTNLISMGLTSIGAIKLSVNVQKLMGCSLKTKDIMRTPTIRQLASMVEHGSQEEEKLETYPVQTYYPLTPNQMGVYIDWEQHPDSLQYNVSYILHLENIDNNLLKQCLEKVMEAHPYLKVRLTQHEGEVMQMRHDEAKAEVKMVTLNDKPTNEFLQSEIKPFNLLADNLYHINIYVYGKETWLLMDFHHIVFDGGSLNVFLHDLQLAYRGESLTPETFSAYDYALYNKEWQQSDLGAKAEEHFEQVMADAESVQYPLSANGVERKGLRYCSVMMPRTAIKQCAQRLGVTESSFFMTALMQVLHRVTREHHVMITTISNGRSSAAMGNTMGMFVQTLPVVSHYGKGSIADTVKQMHQQMLTTIDNDKYPFTKIVEKYGVRPQIMLAYQGDVLDSQFTLGDSVGENIKVSRDIVKLPIIIDIWHRSADNIEIELEYDSNLYSEADMLTLGQSIRVMAERMATTDETADVNSLPIISEEQQQQLIQLGAGKHLDMDINTTFAHLFVEQAHRTPDNLAVADANSQFTYREMDEYSNLLAHRFIALGISPDDLVCVMLERTKLFPLTVLSLHKSGAAYVPLDFEYPNARLSYMLENSESKLLITTHDVLEAKLAEGDFNLSNAQPFFLDDILAEENIAQQAAKSEAIDLSVPEGVAYMIYTSGSTGTPKGARLHQAGLRNFIAAVIDMEHLTADDRISGHRSFSFDAHIEDMYPVLTLGGSFHVMPSAIRKDLGEIRQFLFDHHITGGGYSTAVTCLLLNTFDDLPIRFITGGGEKMAGVYSDHIEIINVYGPTECTDDTSYYTIPAGTRIEEIPIGETIANCWNFVVDEAGHLLPQGIAGELCFAGIQVGLGYWHREEQTAKVYGDCPFVKEDAWGRKVRMYHTGDLCRWNSDGRIEYISRIDTQVKLRGFRIELGEIENAICRYEGIRNAVAEVKDINGLQHLCAYYTADTEVNDAKLKAFLAESLTDYMVPDAYMQMEQLPLTPNGKVNRKALPMPTISTAETLAFAEPEGQWEQDIAEAFCKILGAERISANDDFFALGGTSISAIKVVAALTLKDYRLSFKDVFSCKTPRVLAAYLRGKEDGASVNESIVIDNTQGKEQKSQYADILETNSLDKLKSGESQPLGDVLLTGATGFMGIHFLHELIENESGHIYCLIRRKGSVAPDSRLRSLLFYYFDNSYEELFGNRIQIVEGDTTDSLLFDHLDVKVDTVINCAANVKHFSAGNDIEKVNIESVRNLIAWCLKNGARLVHTSTISVAGQSIDGTPSPYTLLSEHMFDFGQSLSNQYAKSKYDAEQLIFEAIRHDGLNAKIMRVGTLSSRNADGEFQINFRTNGFMSRLKSYALLGYAPYDVLDAPCEFSPIDDVCHACRLLATTPCDMVVFHPCNNHVLPLADVLAGLKIIGIHIEAVEREEFEKRIQQLMEDNSKSQILQPLLAYSENGGHDVRFIGHTSKYTCQVLYRLGYRWPITSWDYVERFIKAIDGFNFFDK